MQRAALVYLSLLFITGAGGVWMMSTLPLGLVNSMLAGAALLVAGAVLAWKYESIAARFGFVLYSPGTSIYAAFHQDFGSRAKFYGALALAVSGFLSTIVFWMLGDYITTAVALVMSVLGFVYVSKKLIPMTSKIVPEELEELDEGYEEYYEAEEVEQDDDVI